MTPDTAYQRALDYLYSFVNYSLKHASELAKAHFDLQRMRDLAARLGNPQDSYPVIHIAGTKGKGSTAAMCASALRAAGYRVGLYTSPHLQDFTERIQVDGAPIPRETFAALVEELKPAAKSLPFITTFELATALAFLHFARERVDAAVVEVGLGGRLDATNIVTPKVSVITALGLEHTAVLGGTLAKIAAEKGGIIKKGVPVVSSPQKKEALQVLRQIAEARAAPLTLVGERLRFEAKSHSLESQRFALQWETEPPREFQLPLLGAHQVENAAAAYAALRLFSERALPIPEAAIAEGFSRVSWPGRFEIFRRDPPIVLDSAHTLASAKRLRQTLEEYFPGIPIILIFGASEDKDAAGILRILAPRVKRVILTKAAHPRAMGTETLLKAADQAEVPREAAEPVEAAVERALSLAGEDSLILSAGSIFITAAVRHILQTKGVS